MYLIISCVSDVTKSTSRLTGTCLMMFGTSVSLSESLTLGANSNDRQRIARIALWLSTKENINITTIKKGKVRLPSSSSSNRSSSLTIAVHFPCVFLQYSMIAKHQEWKEFSNSSRRFSFLDTRENSWEAYTHKEWHTCTQFMHSLT